MRKEDSPTLTKSRVLGDWWCFCQVSESRCVNSEGWSKLQTSLSRLTVTLLSFLILSFSLSFFPPSFPFSFLLSFSSFLSFLLMSTTILGFFILKQTITNATCRKFKQYEKRNRKSCLKSYPHQHLGEGLSRHSWLHSTHAHTFTYSSFYFGNPLFSRMLSWKESQWIWSKVSFFSADMLLH